MVLLDACGFEFSPLVAHCLTTGRTRPPPVALYAPTNSAPRGFRSGDVNESMTGGQGTNKYIEVLRVHLDDLNSNIYLSSSTS